MAPNWRTYYVDDDNADNVDKIWSDFILCSGDDSDEKVWFVKMMPMTIRYSATRCNNNLPDLPVPDPTNGPTNDPTDSQTTPTPCPGQTTEDTPNMMIM